MPKLKKAPKNAFTFFMQERRVQLERQGYRFPGGLRDVATTVQAEWTNLPPYEKQRFEKLAKEFKEKEKLNLDNKFTATGETYSSVQRRMQAEETERIETQTLFRNIVNTPKPTERIYIVMKAIASCEVGLPTGQGNKQVFPLELALAAFNIKYGFICNYWALVDTITIPCGWASTAKETSEDTLLPQPGSRVFQEEYPQARNYAAIFKNIRTFIQTWAGDYPQKRYMIFGMPTDIPTIKGSLEWLVKNTEGDDKLDNEDFLYDLKYYSLPDLVIELSSLAHHLNPSFKTEIVQFKLPGSAEKLLNCGNYDYKDEITCSYHRKEPNSQKMHLCCLNVVLRRIFLLLEEVTIDGFKCEFTLRHQILDFRKGKLPEHLASKMPQKKLPSSNVTPSPTPSSSSTSIRRQSDEDGSSSNYDADIGSTTTSSSSSFASSRKEGSSLGKTSIKRERSPPYSDDDNGEGFEDKKPNVPSIPWGARVKKEEANLMEEDFPPLGSSSKSSYVSSGRGRGLRPPREPKQELEEGETISDDDDDDSIHSSLNPPSIPTQPPMGGRGRGHPVTSGRHGPAYGRWD